MLALLLFLPTVAAMYGNDIDVEVKHCIMMQLCLVYLHDLPRIIVKCISKHVTEACTNISVVNMY